MTPDAPKPRPVFTTSTPISSRNRIVIRDILGPESLDALKKTPIEDRLLPILGTPRARCARCGRAVGDTAIAREGKIYHFDCYQEEFGAIIQVQKAPPAVASPCSGHNCACQVANPDCAEYQRQIAETAPAIEPDVDPTPETVDVNTAFITALIRQCKEHGIPIRMVGIDFHFRTPLKSVRVAEDGIAIAPGIAKVVNITINGARGDQ